MADLNSADILGVDWARRARELLAGARPSGTKEKTPPEMWRGGTFSTEPVETRQKNVLTDPNSWLNRGLGTLLENTVDAVLGEGTGNTGADIALGFTGPGAAVGTVAAGNRPGVLDMLPGGSVMKAGLLGLVKAGKQAEAKTIYNILQNPIANRFANRYPEEALQSLEKFVKKHPKLEEMNTAEVYDVMQSGRLGGEWFVDLGKEYPEALNVLFNPDRKTHEYNGIKFNVWDIADLIETRYGKGYADPLRKGVELVKSDIDRGDYLSAWDRMGTLQKTMATIQGYGSYLDQTPQALADFKNDLNEQLHSRVRARKPSDEYVRAVFKAGKEGKYSANLVDEYLHLQTDPVNWSSIADVDDKMAADIAQYGSVQAAEKARRAEQSRIAMERKAAADAAKESRQYEQRLRDFKKNPKKALKTANSAAPKQVRAQGASAVREWYFGVDPMAPNAAKATPAQEVMKVVEEPTPVAPVPPPEPVAPVVTEVPKAPVVSEVPKGGPNKWRENGWKSEEHPISEPGVDYSILGKEATEDDRRALFVIDSLANEAASKLIRNNRFKDEWPGMSSLRHQGTNYDSKSRDFGVDVAWNARTGNLPSGTSSLVLRGAVSSAGNRLPGQMTGFVDGKDLYDLLFRKKVNKKIHELDNRYPVDF